VETWTNGQNNIQPWQTVPEQMKQLGLTDEDGMEKAWFVTKNGDLFGGAEAVNQAMRSCWWAKPITYLYYLPGIRQLQDWGYQWIAKNRHHLPGSTASCKIDIDLE
jgi:predicted DCC family thiol-disulfide oxidoreductase YuxK